jgi:hypothetical protein
MSKIHVARNQQKLGEFSNEEIQEGLQQGRFYPTDLYWMEGMRQWEPLKNFLHPAQDHGANNVPPPITDPENKEVGPMPSWEKRSKLGIIPAIVATAKEVLTEPSRTFSAMDKSDSAKSAVVFCIVVSSICASISFLYNCLWLFLKPEQISKQYPFLSKEIFPFFAIGMIVLMPVLNGLFLFIFSALFNFCLFLFGANKHGFNTTLRVLAYTQGSTSILLLIPICGSFLNTIWYLIASIIGLTQAHQTQTWKVIVSILAPIFFFFFVAIVLGLVAAFFAVYYK